MEDNIHLIESLFERAADYGKTSYDLVKLRVVDTTSNGISSFIPSLLVIATLSCLLFFINLGAAFWLGELMGKTYYGFFAVAGFYTVVVLVLRIFMYKWIKRIMYDYVIRKLLK
jgi:hypothetical protein